MGDESIAAKLADALSMFWLSLDERERRLVLLGSAYLLAVLVSASLRRARREQEQAGLAERVASLEARRHA